jgi:hypothetical protein
MYITWIVNAREWSSARIITILLVAQTVYILLVDSCHFSNALPSKSDMRVVSHDDRIRGT